MRLQVRVGDQYSELLEHLEAYKPEYRGRRLLALAAMQLAASGTKHMGINHQDATIELTGEPETVTQEGAAANVKKQPPSWIKKSVSS